MEPITVANNKECTVNSEILMFASVTDQVAAETKAANWHGHQ